MKNACKTNTGQTLQLGGLPYLNLSVPALRREIRAMNRGRLTASSQRFSYFGSLAEGEEGDDGAWGNKWEGERVRGRSRNISF